jgi:SAM-dependent methyltransferase
MAAPTFADFLDYERLAYGEQLFVPGYDPYLIRYGEYRFLLEHLRIEPGDRLLDVGCEANIFLPFAAAHGAQAVGIDIDPVAESMLLDRIQAAERAYGRNVPVRFECADATTYEPAEAFDAVIAISAIEHFFTPAGAGDSLAIATVARALRPGGVGIVTVPMSNDNGFIEVPGGDGRFAYSYRLYSLEALYERLLSHPDLDVIDLRFLLQTTPDHRYGHLHFQRFWTETLTPEQRAPWAWANMIFANTFNPVLSEAEAVQRPGEVNTALIAFQRR